MVACVKQSVPGHEVVVWHEKVDEAAVDTARVCGVAQMEPWAVASVGARPAYGRPARRHDSRGNNTENTRCSDHSNWGPWDGWVSTVTQVQASES
jgi:hypothetical protein